MIDETITSIEHDFGDGRAIGVYLGALVMVDRLNGPGWGLSSEPARPGLEVDTLNALVRARGEGTTVTVTPPEGA